MDISNRIKEVRQHFGLSQSAFGDKIGFKQTTVGQFETGLRAVTDRTIILICQAYGVSEIWLRTGTGEMFEKLSDQERAVKAITSKIKTNNPFILKAFTALGELSEADWLVIEKFVDSLKTD